MRSHDPDSRKIVVPLWLTATVGTVGRALEVRKHWHRFQSVKVNNLFTNKRRNNNSYKS